jgi:uridine kinase
MPGPPADFTENTLILITGNSGIGKSTLASFLSNNRTKEDIKYLSTDSFFNPHTIKKYKKHKKILELLNENSNPTSNIGKLSKLIDKEAFTKLVSKIIIKYYKSGFKCVILEGYTVKHIYSKLIYSIRKKHIRIWNINNEN